MTSEINRGYLDHIRRWSRPSALGLRGIGKRAIQIVLSPVVILLAVLLIASVRLTLWTRRRVAGSVVHEEAAAHVDSLVEQYPLHLYPLVAKSLELAYLKRRLEPILERGATVLEIAIGEGTLSARVFGGRAQVTGLDLNPHSLVNAASLEHVDRAVVADGLHPPVRSGSFDLVLSMNFLHHVTEKRETVREWARIAPTLLFNENTVYWASGWPGPYLLRRIGLTGPADRYAKRIELRSLQRLLPRPTLDTEIAAAARIKEEASFLSERTFFLCGLFSYLMLCYGPPTPPILKRVFLGPLRWIALPLSRSLARLLIRFDAGEDRATDTFIFYECEGDRSAAADRGRELICPRCASELDGARCSSCGVIYPQADGMLFLVSPQFASVFDEYSRREGSPIRAEHL